MERSNAFNLFVLIFVFSVLRYALAGYCSESYSCTRKCYMRSRNGSYKCGFLWLNRCKKYRSRSYTCTGTCYRRVCCEGYTGDSCQSPLCFGDIGCQNGGTCVTPDQCVCRTGFSEPRCTDTNECNTNNGGCQHTCTNFHGSFTCSCNSGHSLGTDGESCIDTNECKTNNGGCQQTCINTNGSFKCSCYSGYLLGTNGKSCIPLCFGLTWCQNDGTCVRPNECVCSAGFSKPRCTDINECNTYKGGCQHTCTNTNGSFKCSCNSGYSLGTDGKSCTEINECSTNKGGCQHLCTNLGGSFTCSCRRGYILNSDKLTCTDIDECETGTSGCSDICTNNAGSFSCSCREGFVSDGTECDDIDECLEGSHDCSQVCDNIPGSFKCSCSKGYKLASDRKTCSAFSVCSSAKNTCEQICVDVPGSFTCNCRSGFTLNSDARTCSDIDECTEDACSHSCTNTLGSFECACSPGYFLSENNRTCTKETECDQSICENGGTCVEHVLTYTCRCAAGYNGRHCENDINECEVSNGGCQDTCSNTDGSFSCSCDGEAKLGPDGFSCRDGTNQQDSVFQRANLARQLLPRGCHGIYLFSCPDGNDMNVHLSSTSQWYQTLADETVFFSTGIISAEMNDIALPVSLRGLTVYKKGDEFTISHGVGDLSPTDGTPIGMTRIDNCHSIEFTPSEVYEFVSANSFQKTVFDQVVAVLPDFLQLTAEYSSVLKVANLKTDLVYGADVDKTPWCEGAPLIDDHLYSIFRFDNNFELSIYGNTLTIPKPLRDHHFCLIVDICHGNGGTAFFMIPEDSRDLLMDYDFFKTMKNAQGLSMFPRGIGISLINDIIPDGFDTQLQFWNGDKFFTYQTFTRGDVWFGGTIHHETGLLNIIAETDAFMNLQNPTKILTGVYVDEWNVVMHGQLSQCTLELKVFGIKYNMSLIDLEKTRIDAYSLFGGMSERKWCGDGSSTDIANPPGLFFSSILVVNPFAEIPIIGEWVLSASARIYGYLTTDNLQIIAPRTTVNIMDDILQIHQSLDRLQTIATDLDLKSKMSFVIATSDLDDNINIEINEMNTLLQFHEADLIRGNINNLSYLLEQIWHQFIKIKNSVQIVYDAIEFIEDYSIEAVMNEFQRETFLLEDLVDNAMRTFSRQVVSSVETYSAFGVKTVMTLKVFGLIMGEADLEFSFSNDVVAKCSRFSEVYNLLEGEKAFRILGRFTNEMKLGSFLTTKEGFKLIGAFAMESQKWIIRLNAYISMLGIYTTADTFVSNKGLNLFVQGNVWDSFLAHIDVSAALKDDWYKQTFSLKGRFVAKARHRRQTQSQCTSFQSCYLDALKMLATKVADKAAKRLDYVQNDLTKSQENAKRAQDWLQYKKEDVRKATKAFDNAVENAEDAERILKEAMGPFEQVLSQLNEAQMNIDNLCRIKDCLRTSQCVPTLICMTCREDFSGVQFTWPCCHWTSCRLTYPDPQCIAANTVCNAIRRAAYNSLEAETEKLSVKAPMLEIDEAKTMVSATKIRVDESKFLLNIATEAMNVAQGALSVVNIGLEGAKHALEAVQFAIRGALIIADLIGDHGLQNILDARDCGFEINVSITDPHVFGVTCEVNAFNLGWTYIGLRIDFRNPFQTIWQAAQATIDFLEESLKDDRRKREVIFESSAKGHKVLRRARQAHGNITLEDMKDGFIDITNRTTGMNANISDSFDSRVKWFGDKCKSISRIQRFLLVSFGALYDIANESKSSLELPANLKVPSNKDFDFDEIINSLTLEKAEINVEYGETVYSLTRDDIESVFSDARRTIQDDLVVQQMVTTKTTVDEWLKEEIKTAETISIIDYWKVAMQNSTMDYFEDHECSGFGDCLFYAITNMYGLYEDEYDLPNITTIKDLVSELETHALRLISNNVTNVTDTFDLATLVFSTIHELEFLNLFCSEAPQFTTSFKNLTVFRGSNVRTQCRTTANPEATVWWFKDGELLPEKAEEHLTINGATEKDAGVYKCVAGNIVANITSPETTLFVVESDDTDMTVDTKNVVMLVSLGVGGFILFVISMALGCHYLRTTWWFPKRIPDNTAYSGPRDISLSSDETDNTIHSSTDV